jgi:hypothetical protein
MMDLVVLVADKNMEAALRGMLGRASALGIHNVEFDIFVHPRRDPGCAREAHLFLRPLAADYRHALVVLDHQGSGREHVTPTALAEEVTQQLALAGWGNRAIAVAIAPELEVWVWSPSPHVADCLGWGGRRPDLHTWLAATGYWREGEPKPRAPKEALEAALREIRQPRSSALYAELATRVSLRGHTEPAFVALAQALQTWFPAGSQPGIEQYGTPTGQ